MIDVLALPLDVTEALMKRHRFESLNQVKAYIKNKSPSDIFEEYCEWNGLIHWSHKLTAALKGIWKASSNTVNDDLDKMLDITGATEVEIEVRHGFNGDVVYVSTIFGTKLRICRVTRVTIEDHR